jgi:GTP:adenosylcobinamide-phosphate guanylyltransferase
VALSALENATPLAMEANPTPHKAAYPEPLDAIVLAGTDSNPRRMIQGQNKAFLEIGGRPLVREVVEALLKAASIGDVYVVGPRERLDQALGDFSEHVTRVQQRGKMLANAWAAIHASEAREQERTGAKDPHRPLLVISSDIPLITPEAVDDFVARCAAEDAGFDGGYAMLCGVADESSLKDYYPADGKPGIVRPYVNFRDSRQRLANIYVGRPRLLTNQTLLQAGFDHRKMVKLKNVLAIAWTFLRQAGSWQAAWLSLRMQITLMASRRGGWLYRKLREGNSARRVERVCSKVLGGPIRIVVTPYGGLSLDADNEDDFRVLSERYEDWIGMPPADGVPELR